MADDDGGDGSEDTVVVAAVVVDGVEDDVVVVPLLLLPIPLAKLFPKKSKLPKFKLFPFATLLEFNAVSPARPFDLPISLNNLK